MIDEYVGIERRKSPRIADGLKGRIFNQKIRRRIPVLDLSYHGALLKAPRIINSGTVVMLSVYLPTETRPLDVKARVIRSITTCSILGFKSYKLGVEFTNLADEQKEKLADGIYYLMKKMGQKVAA